MSVDWSSIMTLILNILFVSIPEEICLVTIILIFLKQFEFIKIDHQIANSFSFEVQKNEVIKFSIPVIAMAVLSNVLKYLGFSPVFVLIVSLALVLITIIVVYKLYTFGNILKALAFTIIGFTTIMVSESVYAPLIIYSTNKTIEEINNSFINNFLLSLPARFIQVTIIMFVILRKTTFLKANIIKPIIKDKSLAIISIVTVIFNITLLAIVGKLVVFDRILVDMPLFAQLGCIILTVVFPFINIVSLIIAIYYVANRENYNEYTVKNELSESLERIKVFANLGKYEEVKFMLDKLDNNIREIYKRRGG